MCQKKNAGFIKTLIIFSGTANILIISDNPIINKHIAEKTPKTKSFVYTTKWKPHNKPSVLFV